jgi:hypothetical protein
MYPHRTAHRSNSRRRSQVIPGRFEDQNRWIRCWNCGFPIDTKRDNLESGNSYLFQDDPIPSEISDNDPRNRIITIDVIGELGVSMQIDGSGNSLPTETARIDIYTGGCPFCRTHNLP